MIYTITFNPAIDYLIQLDNFQSGKVNRVESEYKYPGGKGINVSRVLNNLGVKSKALGFIGGFTGEYIINFLEKEGINTEFIKVKEDTRINIKLKSNEETEINGAGPSINEGHIYELFKIIDNLKCDDFIILAGNVQKNLPRDIYAQIQQRLLDKDVKVIVDTTEEALKATLKYNPFLIKPNKNELGELFNTKIDSEDEVIYYAKELIEMGSQNVIISMASKGALLVCSDGIYRALPPKGEVKNSVGAGDALIAGFLSSYSKDLNVLEAFKWGVAAGSATAFSMDLCKKEDAENLFKNVEISKLK